MDTKSYKLDSLDKGWLLVDASDKTLGRLSANIAKILMGKNKPEYTPHNDVGDYVVVINAEKIKHDKKKKQLIYDNAILKVYNFPVLYFHWKKIFIIINTNN